MSAPNQFKNKYSVKVSKNIKVLYFDKKNIVTFIGSSLTKSLKLKVKILLIPVSNVIVVTNVFSSNASSADIKNIKKIQGTTIAKIKQTLIEITYPLYYKLNLVGVGYKVFPYEQLENQLYFKLGFSHLIYFKISDSLKVYCQKSIRLFLFGDCSYDKLTQTAAQIRAFKRPEPYKGKGILYDQEKISLKKGKKI
jgi:large subunit ribosomal protein L6|uniref:Ribosomal protein L6 n=1 Tax=Nitzschia palea TaxID=303400 RepID=A0A3S9K9U3_9STRA|nr:ribosomal protein L6 [Nitzschia palea]